MNELTEIEMLELGFEKCDDLYVLRDGRYIIWTLALNTGNASIGGQHYQVALLA